MDITLISHQGQLRVNPPVLMNEREVAVMLNVCPRSVRNFTSRRILPVIRLGRRRLYRRDAVLAALEALEGNGPLALVPESRARQRR